ncbi:hypothetical protein ACYOEI_41290, partial [Singulisphaera rosea]
GGVGFSYRLVVEPAVPSFRLALDDWQVSVPRNGLALIPVTVTRSGYEGPISLDVQGIAEGTGLSAVPATVPAGHARGILALKAGAEGTSQVQELQVVGKGEDGRVVVASGSVVFAKQTMADPGFGMSGTIPSYSRPVLSLVAAMAKASPIRLVPTAERLAVTRGGSVEATLKVERTGNDRATYKVVALAPPTGLSVAEAKIGEDTSSITLKISVAKDAPVGSIPLGLVVQAAKSDVAVASALIAVDVARAP